MYRNIMSKRYRKKQKVENRNIPVTDTMLDFIFVSRYKTPEQQYEDNVIYNHYENWKRGIENKLDVKIVEYLEIYHKHASGRYLKDFHVSRQYFAVRKKWLLRNFIDYMKKKDYKFEISE